MPRARGSNQRSRLSPHEEFNSCRERRSWLRPFPAPWCQGHVAGSVRVSSTPTTYEECRPVPGENLSRDERQERAALLSLGPGAELSLQPAVRGR
ncbi:hypothetical protein SPURM210S_00423 [Streptomyces purpurascens]